MLRSRRLALAAGAALGLAMTIYRSLGAGAPPLFPPDGRETVASRLAQYGQGARARWRPFFERAHFSYPPSHLLLVGLKDEKRLEVYARTDGEGEWNWLRTMAIQRASGHSGPKLKMGDGQVPEGFYTIESLNPNSKFHLSLRVSYPSDEDKAQAARDGRAEADLGGDIMVHGGDKSVGCLAMGDEGAEDLFVLAADTKSEPINVWLCPLDLRVRDMPNDPHRPAWVNARYARLKAALETLPIG